MLKGWGFEGDGTISSVPTKWSLGWERHLLSAVPADVDLAGDGGGDQRGPAFLQQLDRAPGFGGQGVELGEFVFLECRDCELVFLRGQWNNTLQ